MADKPLPPWADQIPDGAFISYAPTYKVGEYFSRFHKEIYEPADFESLGYYFYDPTEHGFEKGHEYPLFLFLHGFTNALEGDVCINYAGAEFYAKDEYQKAVGGAYILIPLANEVRGADGKVTGSWEERHLKPIRDLVCEFINKHAAANGGVSKKIVFGNSRGATMCFKIVDAYTDFFNGLIPIGTSDISDDATLDRYDQNDIWLLFANGDHGIASINFGTEMGQHCLINPMHCNMMFDDGTPMEASLPDGVTGWLAKAIKG